MLQNSPRSLKTFFVSAFFRNNSHLSEFSATDDDDKFYFSKATEEEKNRNRSLNI